jgi:ubiquinone biosynthesis protein
LPRRVAILTVIRRMLQIAAGFAAYFVFPAIGIGPSRNRPPALRLRLFLQHLGGAWIKAGQALALRFDLMPREYCTELLKLLSENPSVDYALIRRVIEEEFGEPPESLFASFDTTPLATASIAQVHVAETKTGEFLAIKVQRPDAQKQFEADFKIIRILVGIIGAFDAFGGRSLREFVDEFERYTREELDFGNEARSGFRLFLNGRHDPLQVCARIHFEFCTRRVLAMELLKGTQLLSFLHSSEKDGDAHNPAASPELLQELSHKLFWCMCNQIFRDGFFHADPHPANIFIMEDGRIGFVDFGATGRLPSNVRQILIRHFVCLYRGDFEEAVKEILRILIPTQNTDLAAVRRDLIGALEQYWYGAADKTTARRELTRELFINTMTISRKNRVLMPQTMALYYKSTLMLDSILHELSPTYEPLQDLHDFFIRALAQDRKEPLDASRRPFPLDIQEGLSQLLNDIKTIATPLQLIDATLQTTQTRTVLYGVCSLSFCVGAFLAYRDETSLFELSTGLTRGWLVYGLLAAATAVLLLMQRQLRRSPMRNR